jgi:hypothetical protein
MMDEDFEGAIMDAALISAAHRVEHYEIAAFGASPSGQPFWERAKPPRY